MDDAAHPDSESRRGPVLQRAGSTPVRFSILVLAFIVHLVTWTGFSGLRALSDSRYLDENLGAGFLMLALAWLAGAAAIVIARHLPAIARSVITVVSVAGFGITGLAEVIFRLAPQDEPTGLEWIMLLHYLVTLTFPLILAGSLITIMRIRSAGRSEPNRAAGNKAAVMLFASVLIVAIGFVLIAVVPDGFSSEVWLKLDWPLAVFGLVGATTALFLLEHIPSAVFRRTRVASPRVFGFFVLACGMYLCIVSIAQIFSLEAVGIAGFTLWIFAVFGFVIAAIALLISYNGPKIRVV